MGCVHKHYPSDSEVDAWIDSLYAQATMASYETELMPPALPALPPSVLHTEGAGFVRISSPVTPAFYLYWQPAPSGPAPLLVHLPGYGAEIVQHPELVGAGYHVLHVSPMGYMTPTGPDERKRAAHGHWPVLPDTAVSQAQRGYCQWLTAAVLAVRWALEHQPVLPGRISFFGTSQGGGTALLLASMYRDHGVRCAAADLPFLTNFPLAAWRGAYATARLTWPEGGDERELWHALGHIDTLSHARRLQLPVLLTSGGRDEACPPETIASLYDELPGSKSLTILREAEHRYTREFVTLASAWFRLYA
ncbi:acetylxylan esterase [Paenibacillus sp. 1P07SE]|uniref:acetylxylan esterase n=1 Tax=Paenibacillus sp. 1P07SE TaxID=3132209 RepID=UPI0039A6D302